MTNEEKIKKCDEQIEFFQSMKELVRNHVDLQFDYDELFKDKHNLQSELKKADDRINALEEELKIEIAMKNEYHKIIIEKEAKNG